MSTIRRVRAIWTRAILASLFAAPVVALAAFAGPADEASKPSAMPKTDTVSDFAKGQMAIEALRELGRVIDDSEKSDASTHVVPPGRPKKVVGKPSIDAAGIDALLNKALVSSKTPVATLTTDEEFVRRVYLDVTGKLPTIDQMRAFVGSHDKAKRAKLVDILLKTDDYAQNWARYWRDVISYRAPNENLAQTNFPALEGWLKGEFARNSPWDEIVTAIITAEGATTENGASVFGIAQSAAAVEMAGEVSRVFMGVQIQCAQCHDHPNDPWKREQFHEFAAFFSGLTTRLSNKAESKGATKTAPRVFELYTKNGTPRYTMPDLKDPQKLIPVEPKFFLADSKTSGTAGLKVNQRRALAASYVTGQDNPWFAKAFVNRVWGVLMGEGFYNPIDDIGPTKEAHDPEVLEALANGFQQGGYDIQWLFRTILNTKAYQRESRSTNSAAGRTPFASNCPSRLRADQIYDSIAQALNLPLDRVRPNGGFNGMAKAQQQEALKKFAEQPKVVQQTLMALAAQRNNPRARFNRTFGVDPSTPTDDVLGTIPQALFLMNSPVLNNGIKATNTSMLGELLKSTPDNHAVLEVLYLRVLARRPSVKEVNVCARYLEQVGNRAEAFEDILWGLINSTEFVSRR